MAGIVSRRMDDEETLRRRIKQLKLREKKIRAERHRLESQLRDKICKRFKELEEKIA